MMMFLTHFSLNTRKIPNYMSDVHYLQVRDDYSIYSLTSDGLKADSINDKVAKKRNSVEGMTLMNQLNQDNNQKISFSLYSR